jgi:ATP/maltotriose-dependent transcriptional regulator MalT
VDEKLNFENLLSVRENEIFELIVSSKSNQEIANQSNISLNTVKFHIKNIYEKLQVKSRKEVLHIAKIQLKQEFE